MATQPLETISFWSEPSDRHLLKSTKFADIYTVPINIQWILHGESTSGAKSLADGQSTTLPLDDKAFSIAVTESREVTPKAEYKAVSEGAGYTLEYVVSRKQPGSPRGSFSGGFIQYWNNMTVDETRLTPDQWGKVLKDMKDAGFDTVIVQHLVWKDDQGEHPFFRPGAADDATEAILSHADRTKMTVLVGLWNKDLPTEQVNQTFFNEALEGNLRIADQVWKLYGTHQSFGGWYVPIEAWNFKNDDEKIRLLNKFLASVAASCHKVSNGKPVAFSPYYNPDPDLAPAMETSAVYSEVLKDTKVDILILQDGVGARGLAKVGPHRLPYFQAFRQACMSNNVKFWGNLECYRSVDGALAPTTVDSLVEQFAAVKDVPAAYVTWDFFHFMNPNEYNNAAGGEIVGMCKGGPAGPRRQLYQRYVDKFIKGK